MRQRKVDRHLPPCVSQKHGAYWLVRAGKWHRLGTNLVTAHERQVDRALDRRVVIGR